MRQAEASHLPARSASGGLEVEEISATPAPIESATTGTRPGERVAPVVLVNAKRITYLGDLVSIA